MHANTQQKEAADLKCRQLLEAYLPSSDQAKRRADKELQACATLQDVEGVYSKLMQEFCPRAPNPPNRHGATVLVIAPGFGFLQNPAQLASVQQAGFTVAKCFAPNPEESGFLMSEAIKVVEESISRHKPRVILAASKGGAYLGQLWQRGCTIPSLLINAHPRIKSLPKDVKIVVVQGSEEEVWPKPRGLDKSAKVAQESLEALIRTGSPKLCYLYHTVAKRGVRNREGDAHNPRSLLEYDCLPRLVDSLLAEHPPFHFPATSAFFTSQRRQEAERYLCLAHHAPLPTFA